jgi:hypothetical protein
MKVARDTLYRCALFAAALVFVSYSFQWESDQILPWSLRSRGLTVVLVSAALLTLCRPARLLAAAGRTAERHLFAAIALLAAASFAVTVALAFLVLDPFPHIPDGFSYYFQAKIFSTGHVYATAPELPQFFDFEWVTARDGRWFSIFPPGWPALLALGVKAGAPALVNPVLGSACVVVVYALGAALFGRRSGLLCSLFCCLSPFFLFMSSEFMSHTATLLFTALSTLSHVKAASRHRGMTLFGAAGAFCIVSAAALAGGVGLYLVYNRTLVGEWFLSPLALISPQNRMGFGPDIGAPWTPFPTLGHTPWRALLNLNHNAAVMSQDLFGWPISSLIFVVFLAAFGAKDKRHWLSFSLIATTVAAYALYWYHGVAFGARFYFALLPHLVLLTVEGIRQTPAIVARLAPRFTEIPWLREATIAAVLCCFVFGWTVYLPKVGLVAPYRDQRDMNGGFYEYLRSNHLEHAIVFVRAPRVFYYGQAFITNDLPIGTADVIYALDRRGANRQLSDLFPNRSVHEYTYDRRRRAPPPWLPAFVREAGPSQ